MYTDPVIGFSFAYPPRFVNVEATSEGGLPGGEDSRFTRFKASDGYWGLSVLVIPVGEMSLDDWVNEYSACAGDAGGQEQEILIAGEMALRCPIDQLNQFNPGYFLKLQNYIIDITGIVAGVREGGGHVPALITEDEMQQILNGFKPAATEL